VDKDSTNTFGVPFSAIPVPPQPTSVIVRKKIKRVRTALTRVLIILISILLLLPAFIFLYVAYLALDKTGFVSTLIPLTLGIIFAGGAVTGVVSGLRK
jgi:hypothetical protein